MLKQNAVQSHNISAANSQIRPLKQALVMSGSLIGLAFVISLIQSSVVTGLFG